LKSLLNNTNARQICNLTTPSHNWISSASRSSWTTLPLLASLQRAYPEDTRINQMYAPQIRAIFALAQHKPDEALRQLEGSQKFDLITWAPYLRGLAYLDLNDGPNAVVAFQSALKYRGNGLIGVQDYPQSQLGLARAYTLTGDKASAKKAYEVLFTIWKDAEPDLPQFLAAKKEYAAL
jgi:eukaryotic-like serine/threonine-protein kinase